MAQVKKIQVTISTLEEYISIHKGVYRLTDKECTILAAILKHFPDGKFGKFDKKLICSTLNETNSYLNVYIERMLKNQVIIPIVSGYQVTSGLIPQGEDATLIYYGQFHR